MEIRGTTVPHGERNGLATRPQHAAHVGPVPSAVFDAVLSTPTAPALVVGVTGRPTGSRTEWTQAHGHELGPRRVGPRDADLATRTGRVTARRAAALVGRAGGDTREDIIAGGGGAARVHQVETRGVTTGPRGTVGGAQSTRPPTPPLHHEARVTLVHRVGGFMGAPPLGRDAHKDQGERLALRPRHAARVVGAFGVGSARFRPRSASQNGETGFV